MDKRFGDLFAGIALVAACALVLVVALMSPTRSWSSTPANITNTVGVCDPMFPQRCIAPAVDGSLVVSGTITPSGTQNVNVTSIGGNAVTTTIPVSDGGGSLTVDGTVSATQSGTWTVQPGNTANTTPWLVTDTPSAAAGAAITPATNVGGNGVVAKASPGNLYALNAVAPATAGFVQLYNLAAVPADAVTDTPLWCMPLAANVGIDKVFNPPLVGSVGLTMVFSSSACGAALVKVNATYLQSMAK